MKVAMLQLNFIVGDFSNNVKKIIAGYKEAVSKGAELVVCSELCISGYPPQDLLLREDFFAAEKRATHELLQAVEKVGLIFGGYKRNPSLGRPYYNCAYLCQDKKIIDYVTKSLLPSYDVFDETRYFEPDDSGHNIVEYNGKKLAIFVCEDIWNEASNDILYRYDPVENVEGEDIDLVVSINASPYYWGKGNVRMQLANRVINKLQAPMIYVNQVGAADEIIFDGRSFAVNVKKECIAMAAIFAEDIVLFDTNSNEIVDYAYDKDNLDDLEQALVLGIKDYANKNNFSKVHIASSGGIDSALVLYLAVQALGPNLVTALTMPSEFSSAGSVGDSQLLADNLGVTLEMVAIKNIYDAVGNSLADLIGWNLPGTDLKDVTEENIQARIRGMLIMARSNREGGIVLSTGNKSELAVGYCTLYGDMTGGLAVISDVPKTLVYKLCRHINRDEEVIPWNIINKAPSAELRPDQKDSDSLPPYETLDDILHRYVEENESIEDIVASGHDSVVVQKVINMINRAEYKRRQGAVGIKVTSKAFGSGRRIPITARFDY